MDVMLGKQPPLKYYGDIGVKLIEHVDVKKVSPLVKESQTYGSGIHFGMFMNNSLPDCTIAAKAHGEQIHSTKAGHTEHPTDEQVILVFHETGIEQGLSDDDGRYMLGVLKYLINKGFPQADGTRERIIGYAAVNSLDHNEVKMAMQYFGGVYFGAGLPLSAADQIDEHKAWTVSTDPSRNAPGSWGGHAMWGTGFNKRGPRSVTWSRAQQMTWGWWDKYVDECYVVLTPDWVQNLTAPSGLRTDELVSLLNQING